MRERAVSVHFNVTNEEKSMIGALADKLDASESVAWRHILKRAAAAELEQGDIERFVEAGQVLKQKQFAASKELQSLGARPSRKYSTPDEIMAQNRRDLGETLEKSKRLVEKFTSELETLEPGTADYFDRKERVKNLSADIVRLEKRLGHP